MELPDDAAATRRPARPPSPSDAESAGAGGSPARPSRGSSGRGGDRRSRSTPGSSAAAPSGSAAQGADAGAPAAGAPRGSGQRRANHCQDLADPAAGSSAEHAGGAYSENAMLAVILQEVRQMKAERSPVDFALVLEELRRPVVAQVDLSPLEKIVVEVRDLAGRLAESLELAPPAQARGSPREEELALRLADELTSMTSLMSTVQSDVVQLEQRVHLVELQCDSRTDAGHTSPLRAMKEEILEEIRGIGSKLGEPAAAVEELRAVGARLSDPGAALEEIRARLAERSPALEEINAKLAEQAPALEDVKQRMADLKSGLVLEEIRAVSARMVDPTAALDDIRSRLTSSSAALEEMKGKLAAHAPALEDVRKSMADMNVGLILEEVRAVDAKIADPSATLDDIKSKLDMGTGSILQEIRIANARLTDPTTALDEIKTRLTNSAVALEEMKGTLTEHAPALEDIRKSMADMNVGLILEEVRAANAKIADPSATLDDIKSKLDMGTGSILQEIRIANARLTDSTSALEAIRARLTEHGPALEDISKSIAEVGARPLLEEIRAIGARLVDPTAALAEIRAGQAEHGNTLEEIRRGVQLMDPILEDLRNGQAEWAVEPILTELRSVSASLRGELKLGIEISDMSLVLEEIRKSRVKDDLEAVMHEVRAIGARAAETSPALEQMQRHVERLDLGPVLEGLRGFGAACVQIPQVVEEIRGISARLTDPTAALEEINAKLAEPAATLEVIKTKLAGHAPALEDIKKSIDEAGFGSLLEEIRNRRTEVDLEPVLQELRKMGGGLQREGSTVHGDIQGPLCTTAEQPSALGAVTQATALAPKASQAKADVASDADELRGIGHADADLASIMKVVSTTTTSTIRDPAQKLASEASPREASSITSSSGTRANSRCCRSGSGIETVDLAVVLEELRNVNRAMPLLQEVRELHGQVAAWSSAAPVREARSPLSPQVPAADGRDSGAREPGTPASGAAAGLRRSSSIGWLRCKGSPREDNLGAPAAQPRLGASPLQEEAHRLSQPHAEAPCAGPRSTWPPQRRESSEALRSPEGSRRRRGSSPPQRKNKGSSLARQTAKMLPPELAAGSPCAATPELHVPFGEGSPDAPAELGGLACGSPAWSRASRRTNSTPALHTGAGLNSTEAFRHALRGSPDCRPQSGRHPQARAAPAGGGALAAALAQQ